MKLTRCVITTWKLICFCFLLIGLMIIYIGCNYCQLVFHKRGCRIFVHGFLLIYLITKTNRKHKTHSLVCMTLPSFWKETLAKTGNTSKVWLNVLFTPFQQHSLLSFCVLNWGAAMAGPLNQSPRHHRKSPPHLWSPNKWQVMGEIKMPSINISITISF